MSIRKSAIALACAGVSVLLDLTVVLAQDDVSDEIIVYTRRRAKTFRSPSRHSASRPLTMQASNGRKISSH
jgi:hypothetical protein